MKTKFFHNENLITILIKYNKLQEMYVQLFEGCIIIMGFQMKLSARQVI